MYAYLAMAVCAIPGVLRLIHQMRMGDSFDWLQHRDLGNFLSLCLRAFLPAGLLETADGRFGRAQCHSRQRSPYGR